MIKRLIVERHYFDYFDDETEFREKLNFFKTNKEYSKVSPSSSELKRLLNSKEIEEILHAYNWLGKTNVFRKKYLEVVKEQKIYTNLYIILII